MDYDHSTCHRRDGILPNRNDRSSQSSQSLHSVNTNSSITDSHSVFIGIQYRSFVWTIDEIYCIEKFTGTKEENESKCG